MLANQTIQFKKSNLDWMDIFNLPKKIIELKKEIQLLRTELKQFKCPNSKTDFRRSDDIFERFKSEFVGLDHEQFKVLLVNSKNYYLEHSTLGMGLIDHCLIRPDRVFRYVLANPTCASIIIMHNHPSGDCEPSTADKIMTRKIVEAGKIFGINVLDHLIFGRNEFFSFADEGLIF